MGNYLLSLVIPARNEIFLQRTPFRAIHRVLQPGLVGGGPSALSLRHGRAGQLLSGRSGSGCLDPPARESAGCGDRCVGRESIINDALPLVRMGGSVCVYGVIDTPAVQLHKARGPYNFNLLVHQWPTRRYEAAAQEPLCEWLRQGRLAHLTRTGNSLTPQNTSSLPSPSSSGSRRPLRRGASGSVGGDP
jgi:hypothetical protein